jgi:tetratricopeptide (TPR) repeat protein
LGELEEAETQIATLQQIAQELQNPETFVNVIRLRAMLLHARKKYDEAIVNFEEALQAEEKQGSRHWNVRHFAKNVLFPYALVYLERNQEGDTQKAKNLLNQALELHRKMNSKKEIERIEAILLSLEKGTPIPLEGKFINLVSSGYAVLDQLLYGGIRPTFSVVLTCSSSNERDTLIEKFLETGAKNGEIIFYLTTNPGLAGLLAQEFPSSFYLFVCNPRAEAIIRGAPNVFTMKGVENLTNINITLTQAIRKIDPILKTPKRICLSLLSDILLQQGSLQIRKWLTELLAQLRSTGFTTLAVIDPLMHPPRTTPRCSRLV